MRSFAVIAVVSCAPVIASAAPPEAPRAVETSTYADAFAEGQRLMSRKQFAAAAAAFERAVAARPDDPTALSELGSAQLQAGKPQRARATSERAVAMATAPKLRAASLYNLGRAQEALGQLDDAKASYAESLKLRPNRHVEAALARLASSVTRAVPVHALKGPFASLGAYCKSFLEDNAGGRCTAKLAPLAVKPRLAAPFVAAGTFETRTGPQDDLTSRSTANLALRMPRGWFIAEGLLDSGPQGDPKDSAQATFPGGRIIEGSAIEPRALAIEFAQSMSRRGEFQAETEGFFVCGVGPGGPACSARIVAKSTGSRSNGGGADEVDEYSARIAFLAGPAVSVKVKTRPRPDSEPDPEQLDPGTYRVVFP